MTQQRRLPSEAVARHISAPRLRPFLEESGHQLDAALELYRWNIEISAAVFEVLHSFEVVLRNAVDRHLSTWNGAQPHLGARGRHSINWTMDPADLAARLVGREIRLATRRAHRAASGRPNRAVTHHDVVAQMPLSTWRYLLPGNDPGRQLLWTQCLSGAFPFLIGSPEALTAAVDRVYRLRNRVAHLEPLLRTGSVLGTLRDAYAVLGAIDPVARDWVTSQQRVTAVARARPQTREPGPRSTAQR